ncbi:MAG: hypothetical protein C0505_03995 [Leptothrix sp. (in: Bacteria)]|nr:hypothetical protein [Leptothrix sp. (in: b-proteobacteria)]
MDADRNALTSARPAIEIDGRAQPRLDAGLMRIALVDGIDGQAHAEAEFGNWGGSDAGVGYLWFDRATLDFGKRFTVKLGDSVVFEGRISALEARFPEATPPTLALRAEDALQDLRMTRRTRHFANQSDADVVRAIAGDHGLQTTIDLPGAALPLLVQANESDLAFLRRRARAMDADLFVRDGTLHAVARASRAGPALRLSRGAELREFTVAADLAHQRTALVCSGWDVAAKQAVAARAEASVIQSEAQAGDSGLQLLQQAFGARTDTLTHRVPFDESGARAEAEALLRTLARRFVRGRGTAAVNAALHAGGRVDLVGLGPLFSGEYGVLEVTHRFDAGRGLRSEFTVERPWLGRT